MEPMSLTIKDNNSGDFERVPEGNYVARCYKIIDLGRQSTEWNGETKERQKIMVAWEILDDDLRMKDGRPFSISKRYTASLNERSQLRKDLQAWRGKRFTDEELEGFDLKKVLGQYCAIQVLHGEGTNGNTYENVEAIMFTREKPTAVNDDVWFDISAPDMEIFETFSDRLKETIKASPDWSPAAEQATETKPVNQATASKDVASDDIDLDNDKIDLSEIPF